MRHWAYDDPFITFRYAANLLKGRGFVYNYGQKVLSTTTPLYVLLLASLGKLWSDLPSLSNLISAISLGLGALFLGQLAEAQAMPWAGYSSMILYSTFPLLYGTFGSEMCFYLMLCLGALAWYAARRYTLTALFAALAVLTRADAVVLVAILALDYLFRHFKHYRSMPWSTLIIFTFIVVPWFVFAWWYFGSPLPVTLMVKQHQGQMAISQSFASGFLTLVRNYGRFWNYRVEAGLALLGLGYALALRREWAFSLAWPFSYFAAYVALGVSRYFWYYAPLVPGFVMAVGLGTLVCDKLLSRVLKWRFKMQNPFPLFKGERMRVITLGIVLLLAVFQAMGVWRLHNHPDRRVHIYRTVGEWLYENTPPEAVIGTLEVGIIGYYSQRPMIDFAGLIQPTVALQLTQNTTYQDAAIWAIENYRPDYLVLNPLWFPKLMENYVETSCKLVKVFKGGPYGYPGELHIYSCSWS